MPTFYKGWVGLQGDLGAGSPVLISSAAGFCRETSAANN
jgi:hypothetical protein